MDPELEALILAFDAAQEASGIEGTRLQVLYESRVDDVLARRPGLSRERLESAIRLAQHRWLRAQKKPSSLPPKA